MIITIYKGNDSSYVLLGSRDDRFVAVWGTTVKVPVSLFFTNLNEISTWVNNELGEECLFEFDER